MDSKEEEKKISSRHKEHPSSRENCTISRTVITGFAQKTDNVKRQFELHVNTLKIFDKIWFVWQ